MFFILETTAYLTAFDHVLARLHCSIHIPFYQVQQWCTPNGVDTVRTFLCGVLCAACGIWLFGCASQALLVSNQSCFRAAVKGVA